MSLLDLQAEGPAEERENTGKVRKRRRILRRQRARVGGMLKTTDNLLF